MDDLFLSVLRYSSFYHSLQGASETENIFLGAGFARLCLVSAESLGERHWRPGLAKAWRRDAVASAATFREVVIALAD